MRAAWTLALALAIVIPSAWTSREVAAQQAPRDPNAPVLVPPVVPPAARPGAVPPAKPVVPAPASSLFSKDGDLPPLPPTPKAAEKPADDKDDPDDAADGGRPASKDGRPQAKTKSDNDSEKALAKFKLKAIELGEKRHGPPADLCEARSLKLEAEIRLKALDAIGEKSLKPGQKALRDLYRERLALLDNWAKAVAEKQAAEHPDPDPERLTVEHKAEMERTNALLLSGADHPDSLLPQSFQKIPPKITDAVLNELRDGVEDAKKEVAQRLKDVEAARKKRGESGPEVVAKLRSERDKIHQRISTLIPRRKEREDALASAKSDADRELARERLTNFDWEAQVEKERLSAKEAQIALDGRNAEEALEWVKLKSSQSKQAQQVLAVTQKVYASVVEGQSRELQKAVAQEKEKAAKADDPIAKFQARRKAELLDLETKVLAYKKELSSTPRVSEDEQKKLANRAEEEFGELKARLDDGETSRLDLLRLNNDLRRIGPEKESIERTELELILAELNNYENLLTDAELELANDDRDDRLEHEAVLEQLPKERRSEALKAFADIEGKHRNLLYDRKETLKKLADRADSTHKQVQRRIAVLEQEDAFIRANIYWVRDEEPITTRTWSHAQSDIGKLAWAGLKLAEEPFDRTLWGKVSETFLVLGSLALALPWPLWWARRRINRLRDRDDLPVPQPAAILTPSGSPKLTDSGVVAQL